MDPQIIKAPNLVLMFGYKLPVSWQNLTHKDIVNSFWGLLFLTHPVGKKGKSRPKVFQ